MPGLARSGAFGRRILRWRGGGGGHGVGERARREGAGEGLGRRGFALRLRARRGSLSLLLGLGRRRAPPARSDGSGLDGKGLEGSKRRRDLPIRVPPRSRLGLGRRGRTFPPAPRRGRGLLKWRRDRFEVGQTGKNPAPRARGRRLGGGRRLRFGFQQRRRAGRALRSRRRIAERRRRHPGLGARSRRSSLPPDLDDECRGRSFHLTLRRSGLSPAERSSTAIRNRFGAAPMLKAKAAKKAICFGPFSPSSACAVIDFVAIRSSRALTHH